MNLSTLLIKIYYFPSSWCQGTREFLAFICSIVEVNIIHVSNQVAKEVHFLKMNVLFGENKL